MAERAAMGDEAVMGRDGLSAHPVRLPQFEGPLDVLLRLIERREVEITAISLTAVADQFLAHVASLAGSDAALLSDFVALAARLVLIKSQALLPRPAAAATTDEETLDDAEALARQLAAYRQARATALALAARQAAGWQTFARPVAPLARAAPPPLAPVGLDDLVRAVRRRLLTLPAAPALTPGARLVSLAETVAAIEALLARDGRTSLSALLARATSRPAAIVTFIALLELIRRRRILTRQMVLFGEIEVVPWTNEVAATLAVADD